MAVESQWWKEPLVISTIVIATASAIYTVFSILLWRVTARYTKTTEKMFEASHRPFIGVEKIDITDEPGNNRLTVVARLTNFGSFPANRLLLSWNLTVNGAPLLPGPSEGRATVLFPRVAFKIQHPITGPTYTAVTQSPAALEFSIDARYQGVEGREYRSQQRYLYNRELKTFDVLEGQST